MVRKGGLLRSLVSVTLFFAATTTIGHQPAADATSSADVAPNNCAASVAACLESEFCASCVSDYDQGIYEECLTAKLNSLDFSSASVGCDFQTSIVPCCNDQASQYSCMISDVYVEYWQCFMLDVGCPVSDISCDGFDRSPDGSNSSNNSGAARSRKSSGVVFSCVLGLAAAFLGLLVM